MSGLCLSQANTLWLVGLLRVGAPSALVVVQAGEGGRTVILNANDSDAQVWSLPGSGRHGLHLLELAGDAAPVLLHNTAKRLFARWVALQHGRAVATVH